MKLSIKELAEHLNGVLEGDSEAAVSGVSSLQDAGPEDISFLANPKYAQAVKDTRAAVVIVKDDWKGEASCSLIRVANPDAAFTAAANLIGPTPIAYEPGIHRTAVVAADAELGEAVSVGPYCVIESGARIGDGTVLCAFCYVGHESVIGANGMLYPFVSVRERVTIGKRVILHNGAVVGSDGFGNYRDGSRWIKIPQIGTVELGDDVEIGAGTTIDRARFGKTVIADGAKIDNLVQIAHNVEVGENTAMAAQVGISGSTKIGSNCMVGGKAGFAGHINVGDNAVVGAYAGVASDVPAGKFYLGQPAVPHKQVWRMHASVQKLPALIKQVRALEKRIAALEGKDGAAE